MNPIGEAKLREQLMKTYKHLVDKTGKGNTKVSLKKNQIRSPNRNNLKNAQNFANVNQIEQLRSNVLKRNKRRSSK